MRNSSSALFFALGVGLNILSPQVSAAESSLETAKNLCRDALNARFMQKGDSWFVGSGARGPNAFMIFQEDRRLHESIDTFGLTEADRLNGVEWSGQVRWWAEMYRKYHDGKWGEWQQNKDDLVLCNLMRKNGAWHKNITYGKSYNQRPTEGEIPH